MKKVGNEDMYQKKNAVCTVQNFQGIIGFFNRLFKKVSEESRS